MSTGTFTGKIRHAKSVDLIDVAKNLGYTPVRVGSCHSLKEMDSIRIYDRRSWFRWSDKTGGSQIDFLLTFTGMDFKEAIDYLQDYSTTPSGVVDNPPPKPKTFILPYPSSDNMRVKTYLTKVRMISPETVDRFIKDGLIYEESIHHNIVFTSEDTHGVIRYAALRGTTDKNGKSFKCDVAGSNKAYGFHLEAPGSDTVRVFEGAIDLMSFYDATKLTSDHLLALGTTADISLERYLMDRKNIHVIILCLDNDEPGKNTAKDIQEKYEELGFTVKNLGSPKGYKDYNEWLVNTKNRSEFVVCPETNTRTR